MLFWYAVSLPNIAWWQPIAGKIWLKTLALEWLEEHCISSAQVLFWWYVRLSEQSWFLSKIQVIGHRFLVVKCQVPMKQYCDGQLDMYRSYTAYFSVLNHCFQYTSLRPQTIRLSKSAHVENFFGPPHKYNPSVVSVIFIIMHCSSSDSYW